MRVRDLKRLLRSKINEETPRVVSNSTNWVDGYREGQISAWDAVLYWLGEKQAVREHEEFRKKWEEEKANGTDNP